MELIGRRALLPPLGLLTLAALLPGHWKQRLVDENVAPVTAADLEWADYVFVGGMGVQWVQAKDVIARAKAAGKKVVGGGPLFLAGYALFQEVDHFVLNEAELTMKNFVADLENGSAKRMYRSRDFADMTHSPTPLWGLADLSKYALAGVQYSRGCPFDCDFCNVTAMLGRNPRIKAAGQIIAELDALRAAGWRDRVFFVDDNLIGNKRHLRDELLPALIEWQERNGHWPLITQASINLADDEHLMEQMVRAGFDTVFVGVESSDPASLEECQKRQNRNRDLIADIKKMQRAGLEVQAGFIVGFDHDTEGTFQEQVDFIQASGIVSAMVGQLQAPPGTKLRTRMAMEGRLRGITLGDNTDGTTNIMPVMGVEKLRAGYAWMQGELYSPRRYYQRVKTLLKNFPNPRHRRPVTFNRWRALLRALWQFGVTGAERVEFWRLLAWVLRCRPQLLAHAIRLAAVGHHQRLIAERIAREASTAAAPMPMMQLPLATMR